MVSEISSSEYAIDDTLSRLRNLALFVEGHSLLALDGTGYFSSQQIHCESC
jgi:hypothetical protein